MLKFVKIIHGYCPDVDALIMPRLLIMMGILLGLNVTWKWSSIFRVNNGPEAEKLR